jgi:hypothetical protein
LNIKKELRATVTPNMVHEDHLLAVNFGHGCDATHEQKSVTTGRESQPRRRWPSAG